MKRWGELHGEQKFSLKVGATLVVTALGMAALFPPRNHTETLAGNFEAAPLEFVIETGLTEAPIKMNPAGIPEERCAWTPNHPQELRKTTDGKMFAKVDGRCRPHDGGAIRPYAASRGGMRVTVDGNPLMTSPGKEVEVICSVTGDIVANDEKAISDQWIQARFPYGDKEETIAFLPATDLGFLRTYGDPAAAPIHNFVPNCPR
jgi:hypothetical protein